MTSGLARLQARVGEGAPCSRQKPAWVRLVWSRIRALVASGWAGRAWVVSLIPTALQPARRLSVPYCPLLVLPLWLPRRSEERELVVSFASETKALVTMLMCCLSVVTTLAAAVSQCRLSWTRCCLATSGAVCRRSVVTESGDGMDDRSLADGDAAVTYPRASTRLASRTTPIVLLDIGRSIS